MKTTLCRAVATTVLTLTLCAVSAAAAESGHVNFEKLLGPEKGEYVDITLGKGVLKLVSVVARCKNPEAAKLIAGLSRVRVNVVGLDDSNREQASGRIETVRNDLVRDGWEQIVAARGKKHEDVAVFLKQRDGEVIDGIVVTVIDRRKNEAVFVNVVGHIKAEQLGMIGEQLDIAPLRRIDRAEKS